jgi:hypothetical protein
MGVQLRSARKRHRLSALLNGLTNCHVGSIGNHVGSDDLAVSHGAA